MMDDESLSPGRLMVVEQEGIFVVVSEDDPSDWIASFTPGNEFPARDWAERMADLYNLRHDDNAVHGAECPPRFSGTHHPRVEP
jgi:hypothetical protein